MPTICPARLKPATSHIPSDDGKRCLACGRSMRDEAYSVASSFGLVTVRGPNGAMRQMGEVEAAKALLKER